MVQIVQADWIHVMDDYLTAYFVAANTQITSVIASDNHISNPPPFGRGIESLIEYSVKSECINTYCSIKT